MPFNSVAFMLFLPIAFVGYWLVDYLKQTSKGSDLRLKFQNLFLLVASYVFYGWLNWRFLFLVAFISVWAWLSGWAIKKASNRGISKSYVTLALIVNFSVLVVFKYYGFFMENVVALLNSLGFHTNPTSLKIILPIGLSFYTFQAAGYIIDVYRGTIQPCRDTLAFFAYMSFFPQILAGPISRAAEQLPQFNEPRHFDYALAVEGCRQMLWGFFKKFAVADTCAVFANLIFDNTVSPTGIGLISALVAYTLQIYCDFSGYSDLAIGCGKLFGIRLARNFAAPYFSTGIADFWRRWHMSLMAWFKDYLYIPLGGSRTGRLKRIRNTFIVFLVSGLWHGANWTFVLWGAFHACAFLPRLLGVGKCRGEGSSRLRSLGGWVLTMGVVIFGWLIFRAPSLAALGGYLAQIPHLGAVSSLAGKGLGSAVPLAVVVIVVEWLGRRGEFALQRLPFPLPVRWAVYLFLFVLIGCGMPTSGGDFIYGQF